MLQLGGYLLFCLLIFQQLCVRNGTFMPTIRYCFDKILTCGFMLFPETLHVLQVNKL